MSTASSPPDRSDAPRRRRREGRDPRVARGPIVLVVVLAVGLAAAVGSAAVDDDGGIPAGADDAAVIAGEQPASTTWYCAAGTSNPDGRADETIVVTNVSPEAATVVVTVEQGRDIDAVSRTVELAGASQERVRVADVVAGPDPGVVVETFGGEVVVEHELRGAGDVAVGPCATRASRAWYFASGTTVVERALFLELFNPFGDDASVSVTLFTDEGVKSDPGLERLTVPAHGRVAAPIHEALPRQDVVAMAVEAERGRVVAEQTAYRTGDTGGLSLTLGVPAPAPSWTFPDGVVGDDVNEALVVLNPGDVTAEVEVSAQLVEGVAEPQFASLPGRSVALFDLGQILAEDVRHRTLVRTVNDVPVVAEQRWSWQGPTGRIGTATTLGATDAASAWAYALAAVDEDSDDQLVVVNPALPGEGDTVRLSVTLTGSGETRTPDDLAAIELPPGGRRALGLAELDGATTSGVLVEADGPIFSGMSAYPSGVTTRIGVPVR